MHMLLYRLIDYVPQKFIYKQPIRIVTSRGPTPLKNKSRGKTVPNIAQKKCRCSFIHMHLSTSALPGAQSFGGRTHEALGPVTAL